MKVLSIRQPWVWAIFDPILYKDIENRDWRTYTRGLIAIHASSSMTKNEYHWGMKFIQDVARATGTQAAWPPPEEMAMGVIVGVVKVMDCVMAHPSPWFMGEYGFVLGERRLFKNPIPCKGARGFWEVPQIIRAQFAVEYEQAIEIRRPYAKVS